MERGNIEKLFQRGTEINQIEDIKEKIKESAALLDLDPEELANAYNETGDLLEAELQVEERKLLGKEVSDTITLNGNIIPEDLYDSISKAAQVAIFFKQNREEIMTSILNLQENERTVLTPLQIAQLLVNTSQEDKPLFSSKQKDFINELCEQPRIYSPIEAQSILRFLQRRRLSTRENTDLYNRILKCMKNNCKYEYLLTEEGTMLRTREQDYTEEITHLKNIDTTDKPYTKKIEFKPKRNKL